MIDGLALGVAVGEPAVVARLLRQVALQADLAFAKGEAGLALDPHGDFALLGIEAGKPGTGLGGEAQQVRLGTGGVGRAVAVVRAPVDDFPVQGVGGVVVRRRPRGKRDLQVAQRFGAVFAQAAGHFVADVAE